MGWKSILCLHLFVVLGSVPISADQFDEIEISTERIENTATSTTGTRVIELTECWRITEDPDEPLLGLIVDVNHDSAGNICLLDYQMKTVWIYSKEGELIRNIGREGDGPGEFRRPYNIHLWPDAYFAVASTYPPRYQLYRENGDPADVIFIEPDIPLSEKGTLSLRRSVQAGNHIAVEIYTKHFENDIEYNTRRICTLTLDGCLNQTFYYHEYVTDLNKKITRPEDQIVWPASRWTQFQDGRICWTEGYLGYAINMLESDGREAMIIHRDYESLNRSPLEKRRAERQFEKGKRYGSNITYTTSDYHRDIESMYARPDGSLWVMNSKGRWALPEGAIAAFDVYNRDGRFFEEVILNARGDLSNDQLYLLDDHVVIVYDFWDRAYRMGGTVTPDSDQASGSSVDAMVICYSLN